MGCVSCTVGLYNDLLTLGLLLIMVVNNFVSVFMSWSSLPWLCRAGALGGIIRALLNVVWTWVGGAFALVMLLSKL